METGILVLCIFQSQLFHHVLYFLQVFFFALHRCFLFKMPQVNCATNYNSFTHFILCFNTSPSTGLSLHANLVGQFHSSPPLPLPRTTILLVGRDQECVGVEATLCWVGAGTLLPWPVSPLPLSLSLSHQIHICF